MASIKIQKKRKNIGSFKSKAFGMDKEPFYDVYELSRNAKQNTKKQTGIVYDHEMAKHKCLWDPDYQECPERYIGVMNRCKELDLLDRCLKIDSRYATDEEILSKHSEKHLQNLRKTANSEDAYLLEQISSHFDSIYINSVTYKAALLAAGSAIELMDAVCSNKIQNGMAIIRPPGHHAMKSEYCGYCFFNNVAIAAEHALQNYGISKILIVDWDVHHGQATQQMFYDDPRVVYFSIHRYENGTFWPNLRESNYDFIGTGNGKGCNFNVPLNVTGLGNADYLAIFHQILMPMAIEFQPEIIIISAGYDAAIGCPEYRPQLILVSAGYDAAIGDEKGEMLVTPACYAHLLTSLTGLANGKLAVILEGGYCLKTLAEGAALTLRALLGDPCPDIGVVDVPHPSVQETILNVIYTHRNYWKCYKLQGSYSNHDRHADPLMRRHLPTVKFDFNGPYLKTFPTRNCYPVRSEDVVEKLNAQINQLIVGTKLLSPPHKVCFAYDTIMMEHKNYLVDHPEKPERLSEIHEMFKDYDLLDRLYKLPSRYVIDEELLAVHPKEYVDKINQLQNVKTPKEFGKLASKYHSVYFHQESYKTACWAAGSLLQVVDSVLNEESASGIAIIRPPGHHAGEEEACGFCIFNNVAIAAKYAINAHGLNRILILDWDVHHGNGTQEIFYSDRRVLYISLHRFAVGKFFPATPNGGPTYVGENEGIGYNVNIPWTERGIGNDDYNLAFFQVILPIAYQFNPQLVLVSAGFDAAINDPLGGCKVTPDAYAHFTHWLMPLAGGKIILCLEGGYHLMSLSYSLTMCTKALLDDPLPRSEFGKYIKNSAVATVRKVIQVQRQYWPCLNFYVDLPKDNVLSPPDSEVGLSESKENELSSSAAITSSLSAADTSNDLASLDDAFAALKLNNPESAII